MDEDSNWQFEDQTNQNTDQNAGTATQYNGYSPGGDNTNIATDPNAVLNNDYSGQNQNYVGQDQTYQPPTSNPDWYNGNPNTVGGSGAPMATSNPVYSQQTNPMGNVQQPSSTGNTSNPFGSYGGSIAQVLGGLFSGNNGKLATTALGALQAGNANKQMATSMTNLANSPSLNPFGSQRTFYQQQAQQAVTNPYDSPIVKAQIEQLQRAQSIKDAAAGRRSNSLTSDPGVMAEMAKIAQNYQAQMAQQGGANISPSGQAIANAATSAAGYNANGYTSPLLNALSYANTAQAQNPNQQSALQKFLSDNS